MKLDIGITLNVRRNSFSTPAGSMNLRPYMKLKSVSLFFLKVAYHTKYSHIAKLKKLKLSLCLINQALRHEDVWGSGGIDPCFLDLSTSWR
jgi:hypothetical protein